MFGFFVSIPWESLSCKICVVTTILYFAACYVSTLDTAFGHCCSLATLTVSSCLRIAGWI